MEEKSTQKPKILILSTAYLPHVGGSELAIKNITDRINDFEFDLITARLDKKSLKRQIDGNVSIFRVGGFFSLTKGLLPKNFLPLAIFFKAKSLIKQNNYKLIHAFQASGAAGAGWLLKFFYPQLPFIITMQEGKELEKQGFLINFFRKLIIKKIDRATAISNYLKNYIFKIKPSLQVELIPNGVDPKMFAREFSYGDMAGLENKLGIKADDKVIISSSRLVPKNGIDLLIEAIYILATSDKRQVTSNYKLLLVGDGPLLVSLKFKVKSLNLESKVIFTGAVNNLELPLYLKISDVFVRPSRSEGLGISFLEAMAAGIPIIATKIGGIPDFLEDRKTGLFCTLDPSDIASKINIIFENDTLRQQIIKNSRLLVEEKYDWDKISKQYENIYYHPGL